MIKFEKVVVPLLQRALVVLVHAWLISFSVLSTLSGPVFAENEDEAQVKVVRHVTAASGGRRIIIG
jgi:hypothetical protein